MKRIVVLGIGSRIMTDDAVGICLVEDLAKRDIREGIRYIAGETDVDYCLEELLDYDFVIVIDAFLSGRDPGEITLVPLNELSSEADECLYSLHGMHLLNVLRCSGTLPVGILIGVEPYEIDYGFSLSGPLQRRYPAILDEVYRMIGKYYEEYGGKKDA